MYVPQEGTYMFLCDSTFLDRLSCYPCYSNPEGNVLAATEFVRLLERASGSVTAKHANGTREKAQSLGSQNVTGTGT